MNITSENEMTKPGTPHWYKCLLVVLGTLRLVTSVDALPFTYQDGDLCLGFRKTGTYVGNYEIVVDLGPVLNYINLSAGTSSNLNQFAASQVDPDSYPNLTNLQWSVTAEVPSATTFSGYPAHTIWVTVPRVGGASDQPYRASKSQQQNPVTEIQSILGGAATISSLLASNKDNTATCIQEPYSIANGQNYGAWIEDPTYPSVADLGGYGPVDGGGNVVNLENDTVAPFTTPLISDLYELRPSGSTDPHTGLTSGAGYNVGYFQFNVNGTMSFTRAAAVSVPSAGAITSNVTNGFSPLTVVFTNSATGNITNWVWNFGNGTVITNTTGGIVTNTYATSGSYSVSLTVYGPGGTNSVTASHYIVASPTPTFAGLTVANGKLVFSGTNLPAGIQYRILNATNISTPLANWKPVLTNFFLSNGSFSYTNSFTNTTGFFRLVSP